MNSPNPLSEQANPKNLIVCNFLSMYTKEAYTHTRTHTILTNPQSPASAPTNRILQKQQQKQAS